MLLRPYFQEKWRDYAKIAENSPTSAKITPKILIIFIAEVENIA